MAGRKIIIDLDNGLTLPVADSDDAMALALALVSPEIDVLGCTCCPGNCRSGQSAANTLRLLELAGRDDIPVAVGREAPLLRNRDSHFLFLDKKSAGPENRFWADLPPPTVARRSPSPRKAHELIIDLVRSHPGEVALVMLGALTNLALAILVEPEIVPLIGEVVHMGGGFEPTAPGDAPLAWVTPDIPDRIWQNVLRFNTLFDPEASAIVFNSGVPVTLVPVNVTAQVFQRVAAMDRLGRCNTPFHQFLYAYGRPWVVWSKVVRHLPGAHMHDPLALATVIDSSLCRWRRMHVDTAKLLAGSGDWLGETTEEGQARVAVSVDAPRFEALLDRRLRRPPGGPAADNRDAVTG